MEENSAVATKMYPDVDISELIGDWQIAKTLARELHK
jgi:hypothetical protein